MIKIRPAHVLILFSVWFNLSATPAADFSPVRTLVDKAVSDGQVAGGCVYVLHHGELVYEQAFGYADIKTKTPFRVDTPVVVASISKPLLATVAFRLAEQGKLGLSAPIAKVLPEFEGARLESGDTITRSPSVLELITHTAGMRAADAPGGRPWFAEWTYGRPLGEVVKRYAIEYPFQANPGTKYAYSGMGTDTTARVLEVVATQPRNELLVAELAVPLGMAHTFYRSADRIEIVGPMPTRYYRGKDGGLRVSKKRPLPPPNTYCSSGGAVISTAADLARWLRMIRNEGRHEGAPFLTPETVADMLTAFPNSKNARGGLFIRKKSATGKPVVLGHTGSSGTNCWIDFELDLIGIMLTQTKYDDISKFRHAIEKQVTACVREAVIEVP